MIRTRRVSRHLSLNCSIPPNSRIALRRAPSDVKPSAMYSRVFCSRWYFSSSFSSRSTSSRRNNDRSRSGTVNSQCSGRISNLRFAPRDAHASLSLITREIALESLPQLSASFSSCRRPPCQQIIFRGPPILGRFPLGRDPTLLLQIVQGRVQRSFAHLQYVARHLVQPLTDGDAFHRVKRQNFQQQHVRRALDEIRRFARVYVLGNRD